MNDQTTELSLWLALTQVPDIGIVHLKKLLLRFGTVAHIHHASITDLRQCHLNEKQIDVIKNPNKVWIETALRWSEEKNHHIIFFTDERYPPLLAEIASAPVVLYVAGDWTILWEPKIAIVGSRNPSHTGLELSLEFAYQLSQTGLVITSGLALGVDGASHQGALNANGKTIAVLGSGLQKIYPKRHEPLAKKITEHGCLVSEFPLMQQADKNHFPRRNRIISGLSLGTLVIEAALKSGSLITAQFAIEQNREVFAIPGSIRNPMSAGCLALIQQGAKCVTNIKDIIEEINYLDCTLRTKKPIQYQLALDCKDNPVLACIDNEVTTIDQICARSKLSAQLVTAALIELEIEGVVKRQFGGFINVTTHT
jgi:DNA processing protein